MFATIVYGCRQQNIVSSSMTPTIKPGEALTIDYTAYAMASPKRWDVVVFEPTGKTNELWVFRVAGLPGEQIDLTNETLFADGNSVPLPSHVTNVQYISANALGESSNFYITLPYTVPQNAYFLLGDNSSNAYDSRFLGAVPKANILGKVKGK